MNFKAPEIRHLILDAQIALNARILGMNSGTYTIEESSVNEVNSAAVLNFFVEPIFIEIESKI